jgi:hypothetical protein
VAVVQGSLPFVSALKRYEDQGRFGQEYSEQADSCCFIRDSIFIESIMSVQVQKLKRKWLAPLIFFQLYLSATVFLFFYGPWDWPTSNPLHLFFYLISAQVFIGVGYLLAWRSVWSAHKRTVTASNFSDGRAGINYLKIGLIVTFILLIPTSLSRTGEIIPNIVAGLADPGNVYNQNFARLQNGDPFLWAEYFRILLSPLLVGVYPLAIVFWSHLSKRMKALCVIAIVFHLSLYVATGTNKGLADFVMTLPWMIYLAYSAGLPRRRINRGVLVVGFLVFFIGFLLFFGRGQAQREGGVGELGVFNTGLSLLYADRSNAISLLLGNDFRTIFESLTRYLGQGYYALSMSFGIDHHSTLGFGNSMFLARNADAAFGTTQFTAGSIPAILESQTGWSMLALWDSIYPWLASDVGFIGTLFVFALFSYLFGLSWGKSLITLKPGWIVITYLLFVMFFYIPANNQIFQTGESCCAFIILLITIFLQKLLFVKVNRRIEISLKNTTAELVTNG